MRFIQYKGVLRSGRNCTGNTRTENLGEWVEKKWRAGWRYLVVTEDGEQVAGISRLDGTWWSETDPEVAPR